MLDIQIVSKGMKQAPAIPASDLIEIIILGIFAYNENPRIV